MFYLLFELLSTEAETVNNAKWKKKKKKKEKKMHSQLTVFHTAIFLLLMLSMCFAAREWQVTFELYLFKNNSVL